MAASGVRQHATTLERVHLQTVNGSLPVHDLPIDDKKKIQTD